MELIQSTVQNNGKVDCSMEHTQQHLQQHHACYGNQAQQAPQSLLAVTIVSASYAPCEGGGNVGEGRINDGDPAVAAATSTRDVTPFVRALLRAQKKREDEAADGVSETGSRMWSGSSNHSIQLNAVVGGQQRAQIRILDESSLGMNGIFGDPAPGTSKRLHIHYIISEVTTTSSSSQVQQQPEQQGCRDRSWRAQHAATAQSHSVHFAEHERVYLRRRTTTGDHHRQTPETPVPLVAAPDQHADPDCSQNNTAISNHAQQQQSISAQKEDSVVKWSLKSETSEVVLPLVMPFLGVLDRVQCRLVSVVWRNTIRDYGLAVTIDDRDPLLPPLTRPFLRGMLRHSHRSLRSLFLSGTPNVEQRDLHDAIPHLCQLRSLDISRCTNLDDSTVQLLAQHIPTMQVLYLKGVRNVTDAGVMALTRSCRQLKVLDISYLPLTDCAGIAIGQHLTDLRALYLRDSFRLTNASVDVITSNCSCLEQLTVWGCTRVTQVSFRNIGDNNNSSNDKLVLLNLWGCFGLRDETAQALQGMGQLRSLIVSECHRLTDAFVISVARLLPQLNHLHLRYCKRLTDQGIHAIASSMPDLYSLDLGFCTQVSISALFSLLEIRGRSLAELRLRGCHHLDIARDPNAPSQVRARQQQQLDGGYAGRQLLCVLRSHRSQCGLSVLDVRQCTGQLSFDRGYPDSDPFVQGMVALHFEQKAPGFFCRPARWNTQVEQRLVDQFTAM